MLFPSLLLFSICPVSIKVSRPSFLIMCTKYIIILFPVLCLFISFYFTLYKTSSSLSSSSHGILSIGTEIHIFVASILLFIRVEIVHIGDYILHNCSAHFFVSCDIFYIWVRCLVYKRHLLLFRYAYEFLCHILGHPLPQYSVLLDFSITIM